MPYDFITWTEFLQITTLNLMLFGLLFTIAKIFERIVWFMIENYETLTENYRKLK